MERSEAPLVWIDCEMTGLDPDHDEILSLACYITDFNLRLLDEEGYMAVIHHDRATLDWKMSAWSKAHLGQLSDKCQRSTKTAQDAAQDLLGYMEKHVEAPRTALLAGNSVHADASFLRKPPYKRAMDFLHYRMLDVSAIKEAARRWAPQSSLEKAPQKKLLHDAKADILESIEEASFYRTTFFDRTNMKDDGD